MTTLDLIAALTLAFRRNDLDAVSRILTALDRRMAPEEIGELLAAIAPTPPQPGGTVRQVRAA